MSCFKATIPPPPRGSPKSRVPLGALPHRGSRKPVTPVTTTPISHVVVVVVVHLHSYYLLDSYSLRPQRASYSRLSNRPLKKALRYSTRLGRCSPFPPADIASWPLPNQRAFISTWQCNCNGQMTVEMVRKQSLDSERPIMAPSV